MLSEKELFKEPIEEKAQPSEIQILRQSNPEKTFAENREKNKEKETD